MFTAALRPEVVQPTINQQATDHEISIRDLAQLKPAND